MFGTLIRGDHWFTMTGDVVGFVEDGVNAIDGRTNVSVGVRAEIDAGGTGRRVIDAHLHAAASLARGLAQEDSPWVANAYGPLRYARNEDAPLWTILAQMEAVANDTTTFLTKCAQPPCTPGSRPEVHCQYRNDRFRGRRQSRERRR
jgi:5-methylthioadenosine/S-adenosylhomocysteine deaminase